jgi:predicted flap endonuclease-1-like 5' DNA nuclease
LSGCGQATTGIECCNVYIAVQQEKERFPMPSIRTSCTVDPAQWFRVGEQFSQKYRETLADAQATMSRALQTTSPLDAWATQFAFGARNVRRWSEWSWDGQLKQPSAPQDVAAPALESSPEPLPQPSSERLPLRLVGEAVAEAEVSDLPDEEVSEPPGHEVSEPPVETAEPREETVDSFVSNEMLPPDQADLSIDALSSSVAAFPENEIGESAGERSDDLQKIRGIGRTIEQKLNSLGIYRFAQIAALDEHEIARVDAVLDFRGRIERDEWVAQAQRLQRESATH